MSQPFIASLIAISCPVTVDWRGMAAQSPVLPQAMVLAVPPSEVILQPTVLRLVDNST